MKIKRKNGKYVEKRGDKWVRYTNISFRIPNIPKDGILATLWIISITLFGITCFVVSILHTFGMI